MLIGFFDPIFVAAFDVAKSDNFGSLDVCGSHG